MKINRSIKILGEKIILVPYENHHVPKYHEWMKSEELLKLTASEPLTLEQEYEMQKSWRKDEDKCTFIILDKELYYKNYEETGANANTLDISIVYKEVYMCVCQLLGGRVGARNQQNYFQLTLLSISDAMIGDTNIFIINIENGIGEIEIMIAEKTARGKKLGWEAVILMLIYGIKYVKLKVFEAKILLENTISIEMFKKLGFVEKTRSEVFQEVTLEKEVCDTWLKWLEDRFQLDMQQY